MLAVIGRPDTMPPMPTEPASSLTINRSWKRPLAPILSGIVLAALLQMNHFEWLEGIELPFHQFVNGLCGRAAWFDRAIIFFNGKGGEMLFVIIAFAVYWGIARLRPRPGFSVQRALVFAGYIGAFWLMANFAGEAVALWFRRGSYSQHLSGTLINLNELYGSEVKIETDYAFPSNHGIVFFMLFFMLFAYLMVDVIIWCLSFCQDF